MKSIVLNTVAVRAILEERKTETRRVIKDAPLGTYNAYPVDMYGDGKVTGWDFMYGRGAKGTCIDMYLTIKPPYQREDILYVRETWFKCGNKVCYRADCTDGQNDGLWRPSIHMPREAARIFLNVLSVYPERLQDIKMSSMEAEGVIPENVTGGQWEDWQKKYMKPAWDKTVKPKYKYGWDTNPWVWVIKFERVTKNGNLKEVE